MESRSVVSNLEKLLSQGKESALLRFSLGSEYLKLRETWVAIFHLKRALELDPNYSAAWKLLAMALADGGILNEALDTYRPAIKSPPHAADPQPAREMTV